MWLNWCEIEEEKEGGGGGAAPEIGLKSEETPMLSFPI